MALGFRRSQLAWVPEIQRASDGLNAGDTLTFGARADELSGDRSRVEEQANTTRISVCVPVWNGAQYAAGLVESLLAQRGARWHLYIGDNASTDDLRGVVDAFPDDRTCVDRAVQHRLHPGAPGRRAAANDLVRAWRLSPSAFASTWTVASSPGSLIAPSAAQVGRRDAPSSTILMPAVPAFVVVGGCS